jgi:hypothetical protein
VTPKTRFLKNSWDDSEHHKIIESYVLYKEFLESIKEKLPYRVYEFATADWHFDPMDPKCPHDSWLVSFEISEDSKQEDLQQRTNRIDLKLLGAYHDGNIYLRYYGVINYKLERNSFSDDPWLHRLYKKGHGDWLIDEFSISDGGLVVHNIEFSNGVDWEIEFADFSFEWIPF